MLTHFKRALYRDRRRLTLSAALIVLASVVGYDFVPDVAPIFPTEVLVMVAIIGALPLVIYYFPKQRHAIELAGIANLAFVLVGRAFPESNFNLANPHVNWISAMILYALVILATSLVIWGRWSDRFRKPGQMTLTAHAYSSLPTKALWYGLVPTPGHIDECPDPEVVSIDYADPGRRVIRLINWLPPHERFETLLHIEEIDPMKSVRLRIEERGRRAEAATAGVTAFRIVDEGARRRVEVTHEMPVLPPRRLFRGFMDDTLGRMMDHRLRLVEIAAMNPKGRSRAQHRASANQQELFTAIAYQPERAEGPDRRKYRDPGSNVAVRG